jgi:Flp pilus assembly pilin Flp
MKLSIRDLAHRLGLAPEKRLAAIEYSLIAAMMVVAIIAAASIIGIYMNATFISIGTALATKTGR